MLAAYDRPGSYDPSTDSAILLGTGAAHGVSESEAAKGRWVGRILIPDVEQRNGLREWYVYGDAPTPSAGRPLGFRKP